MTTIVDYGMGNLSSIQNMLKKVGEPGVITSDPAVIAAAERLILPGVGAFDHGMQHIHARGLTEVLNRKALEEGTPVLGICLGMQLLTRGSEEGTEPGLGWIQGDTVRFRFDPREAGLRVPHMGWNVVEPTREAHLFDGLEEPRFYFVHSYHVVCDDAQDVIGWTPYGYPFASAVRRGNVWGTQFHPEKSHRFGMRLLTNFVEMTSLTAA